METEKEKGGGRGGGGEEAFIRGDVITIPFERFPMCDTVHRNVGLW